MFEKKIRVVHVVECAGGVERYLQSILKYSNRDKFENYLIMSNLYKKEKYINLADNVEIIDIPHSIGLATLLAAFKLRKLLRKYQPDVICAHSSIAGAVTRLANMGLPGKCIYNPHGWSFNMRAKGKKIFILLEKIMAAFCDKIICISDAEKESAIKNKICKPQKLQVIYNGIDLQESETKEVGRKELSIPEDAFVVGMVGRICLQKAPDVFVKMAGVLSEKIDNAYFVIVGDVLEGQMKEKEEIQQLAKNLNVELIITGWVNNPLDYIKTFDVACLLSRWEGFGLVIPEYMLCEKPIVASAVDAIPCLIENEENGLLVTVDDYQEAADAVMRLKTDLQFRQKIVNHAKNDVEERFNVHRTVKELERIIEEQV